MSYKFIPQNGGHPLKNDDITLVQDRLLEFMTALFTDYGIDVADGFVLSGCEVTTAGPNYDVAPGYIVYEGEVLSVAAQSLPTGAGNYWFERVVTTDQPRVYQDGLTRDVREVRRAQVASGASAPIPSMPLTAPRFVDLVVAVPTARIDNIEAAWLTFVPATFTVSSGGVFTPDADPAKVTFSYKVIGKTVIYTFDFEGDVNQNAGYIRFGFPPVGVISSDFSAILSCYIASSQGFNIERMEVNVNNSGHISIIGNIGSGGVRFSGQITYELA